MNRLEQIIVKILKLGVVGVFFVPLIYSSATIFPFIFPKSLVFRILIDLLAVPYLFLILSNPDYRPRKSHILTSILALLGIEALATIFAFDPMRSFWGNHERMMGFYMYVHVVLFFLISVSVYQTKEEWRKFFFYAIVAGAVVTGLGYVQYFSKSFLHEVRGGRIYSTFGNSIYLAAYLLFQMYLLLWYALGEKRRWLQAILFVLLSLEAAAFFWARTRGAVIALIASSGLMFILLAWRLAKSRPRISLGLAAAPVILITTLLLLGQTSALSKSKFFSSITQLNLREVTAQTRLLNWKIGLRAALSRPILGWGSENYYFGFNKFYDPKFLLYSQYETWQDHSHNFLIDKLVESGILGLTAFLSIFFFAGKEFLKLLKNPDERSTGAIFAAMIAAYFVQNLFAFDTLGIWIMIYAVLGYAHIRAAPGDERQTAHGAPSWFLRLDPVARISGTLGMMLVMIVITILTNVMPFYVSAKTITAGYFFAKDPSASYNIIVNALEHASPYKAESRDELAKIVTGILQRAQNLTRSDAERFMLRVRDEHKKNLAAHPRDTYFNMNAGQWMILLGSILDPTYYLDAEEALLKAKELSPKRQQIYYLLIRLAILRGNYTSAVEFGRQVVALNPLVAKSHWHYGEALSRAGREEEGYKEMKGALRWDFGAPYAAWLMPEIEHYISVAEKVGDKNETNWWKGIVSYGKGDYKNAYEHMKKAIDGGYLPATTTELVQYLDLFGLINKSFSRTHLFALMQKYAADELGTDSELTQALAAEDRERALNLNAQMKKPHPILAEKIFKLDTYLDKIK